MNKLIRRIFNALFLFISSLSAYTADATHLYGADLGYTYVAGNTYKVTLTLYANCAGAAFPNLIGSSAQVVIYNDATQVTTLNLPQEGPPVEVTPVCPAQALQTACYFANSTIPGIKRFIFSTTYNVPGISANWRFRFNGQAGGSTGRSNDIGNIGTGSTMSLEAMLNNTSGPNSSPVYTTIPTPFFCINKVASYNPGTVDADGDQLTFSLVPGILPISGTVSYISPYTATLPLSATPGTFIFSTTNGQLDFTPNITQKSLVVSQVSEYRGGVLVGTSMREMTFVVVPCINNPPGGVVSSPSTGVSLVNNTTVSVCNEQGAFHYSINPTDADGDTINVSASGLPAGASFNVINNNTRVPQGILSWNASTIAPGNYTYFVTYTDNGCPLASKQTIAYTITILPNPTLTFHLVLAATCFAKAVFTITPVNAAGPYIINFGTITRTRVNGTITDSLSPGNYTFTIRADNGCPHDTSITLLSAATTKIEASIAQNTCNATANGLVTLLATNSTPPYTYALDAGGYTSAGTFSGLASGSHIFHVKDQTGCIKDTTIAILDSLKLSTDITVTDVLCYATSTGILQVTGGGGANPYQYALNTGAFASGNTFNALPMGTYAVHIKDVLGCFRDTLVNIAQPAALAVTTSVRPVTCNGLSDAQVTLSATDGTPGYTYAMDAGGYGNSDNFPGLAGGNYTFHVRDQHACQNDIHITINQPAPLAFTLAVTNVYCNGGNTGKVIIVATGGTAPYTYAADAGAFDVSGLLAGFTMGTHTIHVKDANGCTKDTSVTITQPPVLNIAYTYTTPTCFGAANGTIIITGSGGVAPYTFALNANAYTANGTMSGLAPGGYILRLLDANGCTSTASIQLTEPAAITVTAGVRRPLCTPLVNGAVTLIASGGTPGYTYASGAGSYTSAPAFTALGSGTYVFHVKDSRGCSKDTTLLLTDSMAVHATTVIGNVRCFGNTDGSISINPSGGHAPYMYAVNAAAYRPANPIVNLGAATYMLHVKDANGCILDTTQVLAQPPVIVPAIAITQPLCYNGSDASVAVSVTGGTPGFTYAQGSGAYSNVAGFSGLTAGIYTLHVKDANSCMHDTLITISQPSPLIITSLPLSHLFCNGDSSGKITVHAAGATPPYTYAADAAAFQTSNVLTTLKAGNHSIHLKDDHGCTLDTTIILNEPTRVHVQLDTMIHATCEGYKDGTVKIEAYGGQPAYTYAYGGVAFGTTGNFTGLPEGAYIFYAKDAFGCLGDTAVNLPAYPHILIHDAVVTDATCNGLSNGRMNFTVTGGNQPFTYLMQSPADTNLTGRFDSLKKGTYAIRILDRTGCFKDTSLKIAEPEPLLASVVVTPNDCNGYDNEGSVMVMATGGSNPYSYLWNTSTSQTADKIDGLPNGKYVVVVTDAQRCTDTTSTVVEYDNCCKPYVVNAFTPNADGRNDKFHVLFKGDMKLENFSIYNRFGQRLFHTAVTDAGWDGTYNGVAQDGGTYFYYIRLICGNKGDHVLEYKGDVTLIR